ncbi:MAG TPA: adenylate/guanylate cyclase domain-containing protein [Geminicoccus sp.]|uniref:adenylate/guanylate cyclase domain-containing protein n=1 Tax=Geminicoccus sp. TaxID=2024832 RepID=UPI002B6CE1A0|nr:adenylate/guanylate cyclase domain-containing protein [Geminicoccus sp.]HWL69357.1 adenylate/guanylate cyclase domain-containing protein [Geminicoccus sp.]
MAGPEATRRLAAILAADVAGYTRLMEQNERQTLARTLACQSELVEPLLTSRHGRLVKRMGDGLLAEFGSVVDAVDCAVRIQQAMRARAADDPAEDRIRLRIGINLGDIIGAADGDIYGDGVNLAARLQELAPPDGIAISGTAFDHLPGKLDCTITPIGEHRLKNIARPVRVYRVDPADGRPPPALPSPGPSVVAPSVAVLPFVNLSGDPAETYLSDGITEDIITELARFRPLAVAARTSSFRFRDTDLPIHELGRLLGARFIVEGSVRRHGTRIRITAQLIEVATGWHLWSERFDRDVEKLFEMQDQVVRSIAYTVATRLSREIREMAGRRPPEDWGAYDCFLRGNQLMDGTREERVEAAALFQRARSLDPRFARAHNGLAWTCLLDGVAPRPRPAGHALLDEALGHAERALALDPNDARVHSALASICLFRRSYDRACAHDDQAVALNPNDSTVLIGAAWMRACLGENELAVTLMGEAMRTEAWYWYPARIDFLGHRYPAALARLDAGSNAGPRCSAWRTAMLARLGRLAEARDEAASFVTQAAAQWCGEEVPDAGECCRWLLDTTPLRRAEDQAHFHGSLRLAGLPV